MSLHSRGDVPLQKARRLFDSCRVGATLSGDASYVRGGDPPLDGRRLCTEEAPLYPVTRIISTVFGLIGTYSLTEQLKDISEL